MKPLNPKDQHLDLRTEQNLCLGLQGAHVPCADKKSECTDCETVFAPQLYNSYDSMSILFTHTHTHTHTHPTCSFARATIITRMSCMFSMRKLYSYDNVGTHKRSLSCPRRIALVQQLG